MTHSSVCPTFAFHALMTQIERVMRTFRVSGGAQNGPFPMILSGIAARIILLN